MQKQGANRRVENAADSDTPERCHSESYTLTDLSGSDRADLYP